MNISELKDHIFNFLSSKGVDSPQDLSGSSMLLEHISSMDFMELILHMESITRSSLDMAEANIESIVTLNGFMQWVDQEHK